MLPPNELQVDETSHGDARAGASAPSRRGFALGVAIIALAVIGSLVAGAFFTSNQEYRVGRNALIEQRAMTAAEYGASWGYRKLQLNKTTYLAQANGTVTITDTVQTGDSSYAIVRSTRLNANTFWLVSDGFAGKNNQVQATRRVNGVLRVSVPSMNARGALTVRGSVQVQGTSLVNGNDSIPPQWKTAGVCSALGPNKPGIAAPDTSQVCDGNCKSKASGRIVGNPAKVNDTAASDTLTYFKYGDETWATLTAGADIKLSGGNLKPAPVVTNGVCDKTNTLNWGDVGRTTVCKDYFPIIYVNGDLKLASNATGQGILLVNGSIDIVGGFEFNGIMIARNDITAAGNGNKISGAAFAANSNVSDNSGFGGGATIQYSSCAVTQALQGSANMVKAKQRAWAELF